MKTPSAKIPMAKAKVPSVAVPKVIKAAMSGKVTVAKPAGKTNGQVITKQSKK